MANRKTYTVSEAIAGVCLLAALAARIWALLIVSGEARMGVPANVRVVLEAALMLLAFLGLIMKVGWARLLSAAMLFWVAVTILIPLPAVLRQHSLINPTWQVVFAAVAALAGIALLVRHYLARPGNGSAA